MYGACSWPPRMDRRVWLVRPFIIIRLSADACCTSGEVNRGKIYTKRMGDASNAPTAELLHAFVHTINLLFSLDNRHIHTLTHKIYIPQLQCSMTTTDCSNNVAAAAADDDDDDGDGAGQIQHQISSDLKCASRKTSLLAHCLLCHTPSPSFLLSLSTIRSCCKQSINHHRIIYCRNSMFPKTVSGSNGCTSLFSNQLN